MEPKRSYRNFFSRLGFLRGFCDKFAKDGHCTKEIGFTSGVRPINGGKLLKSAAIYGPNAGGKTNLLSAMAIFREFITESSKESQAGEKIPVTPFRLHTSTETAPTYFETIFLNEGTQYRYGFEATEDRVETEWLFCKKNSIRETRLFTRERGRIRTNNAFSEGKGLEARTRPNALFLSVVAQFNGRIAGG